MTGSVANELAASSPVASRTSTSQPGIPLSGDAMSAVGRWDCCDVGAAAGVGLVVTGTGASAGRLDAGFAAPAPEADA